MPKREEYEYVPIDRYRDNPVHTTLDGGMVAIGGNSLIPRVPPKQDVIVKEATQAQYKKLNENGFAHVIKKVKKKDVQTKEPATSESKG